MSEILHIACYKFIAIYTLHNLRIYSGIIESIHKIIHTII